MADDVSALRDLLGKVEARLKDIMPEIHEGGYEVLMLKRGSKVYKYFQKHRFDTLRDNNNPPR